MQHQDACVLLPSSCLLWWLQPIALMSLQQAARSCTAAAARPGCCQICKSSVYATVVGKVTCNAAELGSDMPAELARLESWFVPWGLSASDTQAGTIVSHQLALHPVPHALFPWGAAAPAMAPLMPLQSTCRAVPRQCVHCMRAILIILPAKFSLRESLHVACACSRPSSFSLPCSTAPLASAANHAPTKPSQTSLDCCQGISLVLCELKIPPLLTAAAPPLAARCCKAHVHSLLHAE